MPALPHPLFLASSYLIFPFVLRGPVRARNVTEEHVREIFGRYGPVKEVDLAMDKARHVAKVRSAWPSVCVCCVRVFVRVLCCVNARVCVVRVRPSMLFHVRLCVRLFACPFFWLLRPRRFLVITMRVLIGFVSVCSVSACVSAWGTPFCCCGLGWAGQGTAKITMASRAGAEEAQINLDGVSARPCPCLPHQSKPCAYRLCRPVWSTRHPLHRGCTPQRALLPMSPATW